MLSRLIELARTGFHQTVPIFPVRLRRPEARAPLLAVAPVPSESAWSAVSVPPRRSGAPVSVIAA